MPLEVLLYLPYTLRIIAERLITLLGETILK
jgi:hypothetical protein